MKIEKARFFKIPIHFSQCFCVSSNQKSKGDKLTPTQHLPNINCRSSPITVNTVIKTDDAFSKIEFQDLCGSKSTLGGSIKYQTLNSTSNTAKLKHTLMHKGTTFSTTRLFHRFLLSAWSGSTRCQKLLSNKISSDRTSCYLDGPMHTMLSVFALKLNSIQLKDSGTQILTIYYYITEVYPVLVQ